MPDAQHDTTWTRVTVECPPQATEAVTAILLDFCPGGLALEEGGGVARVSGYLSPTPAGSQHEATLARLRRALANIPADLTPDPPRIVTRAVPERDWVEAFKRHCRPVRVGRIVVKPTWHPWPDPAFLSQVDDIVIQLDPGMAFGSGTHATTRACLAALERLVRPEYRVVDFGCGSGILSIAAACLGALEVAAIDRDWTAIQATRANAVINAVGCHMRLICADTLAVLAPKWDLIVANIAPVVVAAQARIAYHLLNPGGAYLCSGIPVASGPEVRSTLSGAGFAEIEPQRLEEWVCLSAYRPASEEGGS